MYKVVLLHIFVILILSVPTIRLFTFCVSVNDANVLIILIVLIYLWTKNYKVKSVTNLKC